MTKEQIIEILNKGIDQFEGYLSFDEIADEILALKEIGHKKDEFDHKLAIKEQPQEYKSAEEIWEKYFNKAKKEGFDMNGKYWSVQAMQEYRNQGLRIPSDEEINTASIYHGTSKEPGVGIISQVYWRSGAKWYREQLRNKDSMSNLNSEIMSRKSSGKVKGGKRGGGGHSK